MKKTISLRNKKGLILAGGGAKGVFQIGTMQAFKELGLKFDAVAGTSVGALNAAFYAQDDLDAAIEMWENIGIQQVIDLPDELVEDGRIALNGLGTLRKINRTFIRDFGFSSEPLRKLICDYVDIDKIKKSKIDLGIVTFSLTDFKPVRIFLNDMDKDLICDYLLASASFPLFKKTTIKGNTYIDGGVYDNIPYGMLKKRGYKDLTIVDVSGFGSVKGINIENTFTTYIKNSVGFGNFKNLYRALDFNSNFLNTYKLLGYLDTMKLYGKLEGIQYFFEPNTRQFRKLNTIFNKASFQKKALASSELNRTRSIEFEDKIRSILPKEYKDHFNLELALIENAASTLNITPIAKYNLEDLIEEIYLKIKSIEKQIEKQNRIDFAHFFDSLFASGRIDTSAEISLSKTPHEYYTATKKFHDKDVSIFSRNFISRFPQARAGALGIQLAKAFVEAN